MPAALEPLFIEHGVDLYAAGHWHYYESLWPTVFTAGPVLSQQNSIDPGGDELMAKRICSSHGSQVVTASSTSVLASKLFAFPKIPINQKARNCMGASAGLAAAVRGPERLGDAAAADAALVPRAGRHRLRHRRQRRLARARRRRGHHARYAYGATADCRFTAQLNRLKVVQNWISCACAS